MLWNWHRLKPGERLSLNGNFEISKRGRDVGVRGNGVVEVVRTVKRLTKSRRSAKIPASEQSGKNDRA